MVRSLHASIALVLLLSAANAPAGEAAAPPQHWTGSWSASQQIPEPANVLPEAALHDTTLRQIVHLSIGGRTLRVHLSNAFGTTALHLTAVHVGLPVSAGGSRIQPGSDKPLRFHGADDVTIPPGAEFLSDAIDFTAAPLSDLAVTLHYDDLPAQQTGHPGSRSTTFAAPGDAVSAAELPMAAKIEHWYILSGVDVVSPAREYAVVALGDSITDGHGAGTDRNERWTDVLAARLQGSPATRGIAVLNQGIGGNHMLTDGLGPNVLARLDRDVLAQTGVRVAIVFEGVNDLGGLSRQGNVSAAEHETLVARLIASYAQVIARVHALGIKAVGATITPYVGGDYYHPAAENEADRQKLNAWIRAAGNFDAVIDFDRIVRDPQHPERMLPAYDGGDHLHPSPAGYRAMAQAIPLDVLKPFP
jgi:lysophospholipase L1-like esterase